MCDVVSAAGGLLSLGSMLANSSAEGQNAAARNNTMQGFNQRQGGWDRETNAFNANSREGYGGAEGKMATRAGEVSDFYKSQNGGLPVSGPTTGVIPASSSNIVNQEGKTQQGKVEAFSGQQNDALGKLRSFGDILGASDRNTALNTANVGTINSIKQGDASLQPLRLEEANHTGDGMKQLGGILGKAGQVGMMAGLTGAGTGPNGIFSKVGNWFKGPIDGGAASSAITNGII